MTLDVGQDQLVALLLVIVRLGAFLWLAPPFGGRMVPASVRVALAVALALPMTGPALAAADGVLPRDLPTVLAAVVVQVVIGVGLGAVCLTLLSALQSAGALLDLAGGFQTAQAYDPQLMQQNSVLGRLLQLLTGVLLLVTGAYAVLLRGLGASFDAVPLGTGVSLARTAEVMTSGVSSLFLAALQIAAPLMGVLFVADLGLGLLSRVAPALNAFALAFPVKIGITLLLVGVSLPLLAPALTGLTDDAVGAMARLTGG